MTEASAVLPPPDGPPPGVYPVEPAAAPADVQSVPSHAVLPPPLIPPPGFPPAQDYVPPLGEPVSVLQLDMCKQSSTCLLFTWPAAEQHMDLLCCSTD